MTHTPKPRIAITGLGLVTPLGHDVASTWQALMDNVPGVEAVTQFPTDKQVCKVAAGVKGFEPDETNTGLSKKDLRRCDRFTQLGLAATRQAMLQAGLEGLAGMDKAIRERVAVLVGTGIGGLQTLAASQDTLREKGADKVGIFDMIKMLANLLGGQIGKLYGAQGPVHCPVAACATGAISLGLGKMYLETGRADIAIVGGAEAAITEIGLAEFGQMTALSSTYNDQPAKASQPFNQGRDGFVMGEGAGVLVLETEASAKARGAKILGYLAGYGDSGDGVDLVSPAAEGEGGQRAMKLALTDAGLKPADIAYLNAHATSTPVGDVRECEAIAAVFGTGTSLAVSSTKGHMGHLLGAAGAVEAIIALLALHHGKAPGTLNLTDPCHDGLNLLRQPTMISGNAALSNSFGFGGTNASVVVTKAV